MFGYHVPEPDEAMLISGKKSRTDVPFIVIVGHGKWVLPIFRKVRYISMSMHEAQISETCVTTQGIQLKVRAVIAHKVGNEIESIVNAAQRFVSEQSDEMNQLTGQIFSGHLRSIVGSMTVEQIIRERDTLARQVLQASKTEMGFIGLKVDSFQIQSIDDLGSGYIDALAAPNIAKVQRDAAVARAHADRDSSMAQQESLRAQADYERETAIKRAEIKSETDKANAEAAQAGPLAEAKANQAIALERAALAANEAKLREGQLLSEVVKPAEADAERQRILASAEAEAIRVVAEAAASHNKIALEQQLLDSLPQITEAISRALAQSNLTIYNGAEGFGQVVTEAATTAIGLLSGIKDGALGTQPASRSTDATDAAGTY